jgi:hypothetical protein
MILFYQGRTCLIYQNVFSTISSFKGSCPDLGQEALAPLPMVTGFTPENWSSRNKRISDFSVFVEIGRLWIGSAQVGPGRMCFSYVNSMKETSEMKKRYTGNQIVAKLRQADVLIGKGKTVPEVCREIEVS